MRPCYAHPAAALGILRALRVDEVDRLVGDVAPQDVEVVAVVEGVVGHGVRLPEAARPPTPF
jgi:hypothetical protein